MKLFNVSPQITGEASKTISRPATGNVPRSESGCQLKLVGMAMSSKTAG
jgi:hypothetical protein